MVHFQQLEEQQNNEADHNKWTKHTPNPTNNQATELNTPQGRCVLNIAKPTLMIHI